jgi:hypothetical protein
MIHALYRRNAVELKQEVLGETGQMNVSVKEGYLPFSANTEFTRPTVLQTSQRVNGK